MFIYLQRLVYGVRAVSRMMWVVCLCVWVFFCLCVHLLSGLWCWCVWGGGGIDAGGPLFICTHIYKYTYTPRLYKE